MPAPFLKGPDGYIYPYHETLAEQAGFMPYDGPIKVTQPKARIVDPTEQVLYRPASFAAEMSALGIEAVPAPAAPAAADEPALTVEPKKRGRKPKQPEPVLTQEYTKGEDLTHTEIGA